MSPKYKTTALFSTENQSTPKSTVDSTEISHFQKLGSSWWCEFGTAKALHSMNKLRVPLIRDGLINTGAAKKNYVDTSKPLSDLQILEVGCAAGILSEPLSRLGAIVTGIDASSEMIENAKDHASKLHLKNLIYSCITVEEHLKNASEKYDAVVASEVLEHVNEKDLLLESCVKCLKPGGSIFITTPNKTHISWFAGIVLAENVLNLAPKNTHNWDKFVHPHKVQQMLEDQGCRTKLVHGMFYNPITNTWTWNQNMCIQYGLHAVKN